ncbi:MAG: hypothetical protein WAZ50_01325, partial [Minisyncoccia bacterium]
MLIDEIVKIQDIKIRTRIIDNLHPLFKVLKINKEWKDFTSNLQKRLSELPAVETKPIAPAVKPVVKITKQQITEANRAVEQMKLAITQGASPQRVYTAIKEVLLVSRLFANNQEYRTLVGDAIQEIQDEHTLQTILSGLHSFFMVQRMVEEGSELIERIQAKLDTIVQTQENEEKEQIAQLTQDTIGLQETNEIIAALEQEITKTQQAIDQNIQKYGDVSVIYQKTVEDLSKTATPLEGIFTLEAVNVTGDFFESSGDTKAKVLQNLQLTKDETVLEPIGSGANRAVYRIPWNGKQAILKIASLKEQAWSDIVEKSVLEQDPAFPKELSKNLLETYAHGSFDVPYKNGSRAVYYEIVESLTPEVDSSSTEVTAFEHESSALRTFLGEMSDVTGAKNWGVRPDGTPVLLDITNFNMSGIDDMLSFLRVRIQDIQKNVQFFQAAKTDPILQILSRIHRIVSDDIKFSGDLAILDASFKTKEDYIGQLISQEIQPLSIDRVNLHLENQLTYKNRPEEFYKSVNDAINKLTRLKSATTLEEQIRIAFTDDIKVTPAGVEQPETVEVKTPVVDTAMETVNKTIVLAQGWIEKIRLGEAAYVENIPKFITRIQEVVAPLPA